MIFALLERGVFIGETFIAASVTAWSPIIIWKGLVLIAVCVVANGYITHALVPLALFEPVVSTILIIVTVIKSALCIGTFEFTLAVAESHWYYGQ